MTKSAAIVLFCAVTALLAAGPLRAQTAPVAGASPQQAHRQESEESIFAPLTLLPAPSATRLATGAPGPKYWQNRADYDLKATLDTATHSLQGSMTLRYTNNSPDVLKILWFQTEQSGEVIDRLDQIVGAKSVALAHQYAENDNFELQVTLAEPLKPGKTATLRVEWHFSVREPDDKRMGREGTLYEMGQWYPRLNVYDDIKGWNTESYSTNAEFFLEYGDYKLEVTLPAGYIVAATGTLDNPQEVLTATEIARLKQAAKADTVVRVITADELTSGAARPTKDGMLTWKFHAKNTRDAAWAAAPNYQWDATQWHGILAQSYYRSGAAGSWPDAADMARMSIQEYSERWFPYPYPQISAVEGSVFGMEYPMLAMESGRQEDLYSVLTHEVGHNWFPMIVGSNERVHTWMDEGFNTFINGFSEARRSSGHAQDPQIGEWVYAGNILEDGDPTGNTLPQYKKTAAVLQTLRSDVMGPEIFDKAFRNYIRQWAYKHPTPMDFFRTMANTYGHNLDWFWRECFLEAPRLDQTIGSVVQTAQGSDTHVSVTYGNKERMVMPLLVHFTFSDSTTQDVTYPADVWRVNVASHTVSYTFSKKKVSSLVLDPNMHLPDADRSNNVWKDE